MAASSDPIRLQMLVRTDARDAHGIAGLEAALRGLGFEVTGTGRASISARATPDAFAAVFGDVPAPSSFCAASATGGGLHVPAALADYVESISIAPRHAVIARRGRK
jgi:hypothetical protein